MALKLIPSRPTSSRERTRARTSRFSLPNLRTTSSSETIPRVNRVPMKMEASTVSRRATATTTSETVVALCSAARTSVSTMSMPSTARRVRPSRAMIGA